MGGIQTAIGPLPLAFLFIVIGAFVLEYLLLRRPFGRSIRAIGSNAKASELIGLNRITIGLTAFTVSGLLAGAAGLLLASQVGIGSVTTGVNYTLLG